MLHALIMAGGGGTRFWPRSRKEKPKQFLTLVGDRSLLQQAFDRIEAPIPPTRSWIITNASHVAETARQLPALPGDRIIGEPMGRDTAACIGLGAALIHRDDPDAVMLVMPADQVIEPVQQFRQAIHVGEQLALEHPDALITFGIPPTFASTGYGYIERGAEIASRQGIRAYRVQNFREKPDAETARNFIDSGDYYWNAGIFLWKASTILRALRNNQPTLAEAVERIAAAWNTPSRDEVLHHEYSHLTKISIDYAVMESAKEVIVIQAPFRWDDVGSWLALERMHPQDATDNTILARHEGYATNRCVIVGDDEHLIATVGVEDLLIIQDGKVLLVAHRKDESTIKKLVEQLQNKGSAEHL